MSEGNIGILALAIVFWIILKFCAYCCQEACKDEESTDDGGFMTSRALQPRESVSSEAENQRQSVPTYIPMPMPYSNEQVPSPYPPLNPDCPYPPQCPYPVQPMPTPHSPSAPCNSSDDLDAPPSYNEAIIMLPKL